MKCTLVSLLLMGAAVTSAGASATEPLDLLEVPAQHSELAIESVLTAIEPGSHHLTLVGERGHIINWQGPDQWQQAQVPVSVTLTDITQLSDGSLIAVGHDGVILKKAPEAPQWQKVFDGYGLTRMRIDLLQQQIVHQRQQVALIEDDYEREDAQYRLEDMEFALEDAQIELADGPNKPLLSVVAASDDHLLVTGAYGALLSSRDQGQSWSLIGEQLDNPNKFHLNAIARNDAGNLFIVGENGTAFRSLDQGQNWQTMNMPYYGSLFGLVVQGQTLVAFGLQGNVMISKDNGSHWKLVDTGNNTSLLGGTIGPDDMVYLVGHGGIILAFPLQNPDTTFIAKHPSGATFSSVTSLENELILVGQYGISSWQLQSAWQRQ